MTSMRINQRCISNAGNLSSAATWARPMRLGGLAAQPNRQFGRAIENAWLAQRVAMTGIDWRAWVYGLAFGLGLVVAAALAQGDIAQEIVTSGTSVYVGPP